MDRLIAAEVFISIVERGSMIAAAWVGGMVGLTAANSHLKTFANAIEQGQMLVMLDLPWTRIDEISARAHSLHPLAMPQGADPDIPVFH